MAFVTSSLVNRVADSTMSGQLHSSSVSRTNCRAVRTLDACAGRSMLTSLIAPRIVTMLVAWGGTRRDSDEHRRELGDGDAVPTTSRSEPDGAEEVRASLRQVAMNPVRP